MKPILRAAAAADVEEAWRWYEAQRDGLGEEFLAAVAAAVDSIRTQPQATAIVHRDIRRQFLKRFPYALYYRLIGGQPVVVACLHASRNPRLWRDRR